MQNIVQLRRARLALAALVPQTAAAADGLEITALRAWRLREPSSPRTYSVVRVQTRSGITGYGEGTAVSAADLDSASRLVKGKPATAYEVIASLLAGMPAAQAAINMALLDIAGKSLKAPLYQVLGGPTRYRVRALTPLEGSSDDELKGSLDRARRAGYRAFLVPTPAPLARNQGQAFVHATQTRLHTLRTAAGDGIDFVLDGGGKLTAGDAASLSAAFERFHLLWFEEPTHVSNIGAIRKIAAENVTPLGFGRSVTEPGVFQDLLREDAIDVLRPAVALNGITGIRRMAVIAETYYVAVAPYHDGGPIGTAAALHLAASLPNFYIQQIPQPAAEAGRRMRSELTGTNIEVVRDGFAELPASAGLGITVNERALDRYQEAA